MYPAFSHVLRMVLSIGTWLSNHGWLILSKQDLMSPSSIHCGLVLFESTVAHCSVPSETHTSLGRPVFRQWGPEHADTRLAWLYLALSGYPEDVSSRWISGCTHGAAGGLCSLVAASGVWPFLCFPGLSRGLYRRPGCSCLGFLSLVVRQEPCR